MLLCKLELGDPVLNEMNGFFTCFRPLRFFSDKQCCTVLALIPGLLIDGRISDADNFGSASD